jgi:hypothetical protein
VKIGVERLLLHGESFWISQNYTKWCYLWRNYDFSGRGNEVSDTRMDIIAILYSATYNTSKLKVFKLFVIMEVINNYGTSIQWNLIQWQ